MECWGVGVGVPSILVILRICYAGLRAVRIVFIIFWSFLCGEGGVFRYLWEALGFLASVNVGLGGQLEKNLLSGLNLYSLKY